MRPEILGLPRDNKYIICGFTKCGSTSLEQYIRNKGYDIERRESFFWDRPDTIRRLFSGRKVILITRDPVERTWSHYNYKRYHQEGDRMQIKCSFEEAMEKHPEIWQHSMYDKYITNFKELQDEWPIIFKFENLIKIPDYPHLTKSTYSEELTPERKKLIMDKISPKGV